MRQVSTSGFGLPGWIPAETDAASRRPPRSYNSSSDTDTLSFPERTIDSHPMTRTQGYALITGASAGIGAAFARELAARGSHLILTARRVNRLNELAQSLRAMHAIHVEVIPCDLADRDAPRLLREQIEQRGLLVDTLINNAGYGLTGYFLSQSWAAQSDFLQVLVTAPTELCHRFLPGMLQRQHGRIINVASLAGHIPGSAGQTLYAGAKSYLIKLSQALHLEYGHQGIHTCALCPGFTYSEFHDVTGSREMMSKLPKKLWMDAQTVVRQGLAAVDRGEAVYINGRVNRLIKTALKLMPDRLALQLIGRQSRRIRKASPN